MSGYNHKYGYFRMDKDPQPGFSRELISFKTDLQQIDLETMEPQYDSKRDTLYKAMYLTKERIPNNNWLGTRVGDHYEWITWRDGVEMAEHLSYGIEKLGLASTLEAEDKQWKFMGILAGNRYEWSITHCAGMHQKITSVPLYETLGQDAMKFVINQTKLTCISCSAVNAKKLLILKDEDTTGKTQSLKNLILFENEITDELKTLNEKVGLNMHIFKDVVELG